jgi:transposase
MSCRAAARHFDIGASTAIRWSKRARETGSVAALPMGGKRPFALAAQGDWVLARLAEKPDITLRALLAELRARGVVVSYFGVWHFVDRAGLSFKKKPARQRTGSPRRGPPTHSVAPTPGQS